ncbi:GTP cyclohydrolase II [Acanthopleuribacter pedis]|uniref:GTP cyclohydrolase II n=1 Tax=Acanthopleuribacter pedis TaxID=442870 RepID=A0A8J7U5N4_9BACT|nr:GTP cyclohydrolase II [Acanthopleuribacter pedis]MBO1320638.1 GTP cyclohydrolase II [Acanthopleuribacter pedis]
MERTSHVILTSHVDQIYKEAPELQWGAEEAKQRGPVIATFTNPEHRNAIGSHSGGYAVYRALSIASGNYPQAHRPDLTNTMPTDELGPHPSWRDPNRMISIDPWGAHVFDHFHDMIKAGFNIQPTIAVTKAHLRIAEIDDAIDAGRLKVDNKIILPNRDVVVTKAALEPVWYLPGLAKRFGVEEGELRKILFQETGGMFPELVTRPDLKVLLPPIGSTTAYVFGDMADLADTNKNLTCRVHDECNGSDVFGSDICTCRPYLIHGIEEAVRSAQSGGSGLIVYYRKEGRALGEVTKFLVYNARKRQVGGDSAATYFHRTECVAGVQDARFQELMPDVLHWFGVKHIHRLVSMSDMKYNAIVNSGISVGERISIPDDLIPEDARVEIEAKKAAGYFTTADVLQGNALDGVKGRQLSE